MIVVSGRGESVERVVGLEMGADDYISKPFDLRELLARVRSVLRRARSRSGRSARPPATDLLEFSGLQLDVLARRLVGRDGSDIVLTSGEFDLLRALIERPNQVHTRDELMNSLHGRDAGPFDRAVDVQVGRLRRKIEVDPAKSAIDQVGARRRIYFCSTGAGSFRLAACSRRCANRTRRAAPGGSRTVGSCPPTNRRAVVRLSRGWTVRPDASNS